MKNRRAPAEIPAIAVGSGERRARSTGSRVRGAYVAAALLLAVGCDVGESSAPPRTVPDVTQSAPSAMFGQGMNFGNALEAPNEGEWGITLTPAFFDAVERGGFTSLRVPIRWSGHADAAAPYTIDDALFTRVDWVVENALSRNLGVVLDLHNYDEMMKDPEGNRARLVGIWEQIAEHYRDRPSALAFELLNEPHDGVTAGVWNSVIADLLAAIRTTNPERAVVVGGVSWNSAAALESLHLPADDPNLVATFHYYEPMSFTHQGANWVTGSSAWLGTTWDGTDSQKAAVEGAFTKAAAWAAREHRPLLLGEFGAYEAADMASRARWTSFVARTAESHGMKWAYWEFASSFGVYDPAAGEYRPELLKALIPGTE